jgi:hypothetical protein
MSGGSIGTILGGIVGAAVGFFTPLGAWNGAQLGMMIGGGIGSALDPPKGPKVQGPRLGDLTVQTSTYGAPIPRLYGTIAVFGNIFWLENNQLKEVATTQSSGGKGMGMMGGGGGETTTYAYFATFALGLCEGPIVGVRRIWIGPKLFVDFGSSNKSTLAASKANKRYFKIYRGTDTQAADTRMQAALGAANVPAYRGLAYIVFYDLPLADYGNTLLGAQIKVEVVKAGSESYALEMMSSIDVMDIPRCVTADAQNMYVIGQDFDGSWKNRLMVFDAIDPVNPRLIATNDEALGTPTFDHSLIPHAGYLYYAGTSVYSINTWDIANPAAPDWLGNLLVGGSQFIAFDDSGRYLISINSGSILGYVFDVIDPSAPVKVQQIDYGVSVTPKALGISNGILGVLISTPTNSLLLWDIGAPEAPLYLSAAAVNSGAFDLALHGDYAYVSSSSSANIQIVDISIPAAPVVVGAVANYFQTGRLYIDGNYLYSLSGVNWGTLRVWRISDTPATPELVLTEDLSSSGQDYRSFWVGGNYLYLIDSYNQKLWVYFFIEPTIAGALVPLSEIVENEALLGNLLDADDLDVTSLTDMVRGYRVVDVDSIRGGIEPLRAAWPFDVVQHGYQIQFKRRGTATVATILEGELDAREAGSEPGVQITNSREMDSMLPRRVNIKHFDVSREYDTGEQYAERINTDAVNVRAFDLPVVLTAQEAAQKADVLLYLYWMERYDISFSLPPDYSELEPADVITIEAADATYELRLTSINYTADGRLECKAKYNSAALYSPVATGEDGQSTGVTLEERGDTVFELLDIPLLQDVYDKAGFPVAMTGYLSGWPGGILFRSDDDGQSWQAIQGFTRPGSTIGYATDALSAHGGTVLDKSGLLTVRLYQGDLVSVTEAQLFAGQNWFAYGADGRWEIIGAQNCVLQGDGSYILSDFLRGQMGTEWATGLHVVGDRVIHLSSSELAFIDVNAASIGAARLYRAVTAGETLDSVDDVEWAYEGVNLECLSPCHLTGSRHPSTNDWTLIFVRRSRFAGWRSYVDAELGEASESYEIDIFSDNTYATLKRTLTATSPIVAYTSAQQVADFGGNQSTLYLKIYQLSATVGRGYPLITSITRV